MSDTVKPLGENEIELANFDADNSSVVEDAIDAGMSRDQVDVLEYAVASERVLVADGVESAVEADQKVDEIIGNIMYGDEQDDSDDSQAEFNL